MRYINFIRWYEENHEDNVPQGAISGNWFAERGLPIIVRCTCCGSTMALPTAYVDENLMTYCSSCVGDCADDED